VPTHRVAQSQGCSRETSPDRFAGTNSVIQRQSELEAAVADALVSAGIIMMTICNIWYENNTIVFASTDTKSDGLQ